MAQKVKINGVTYDSVPQVDIPLAEGSGMATFYDTSGDSAVPDAVLYGEGFHGASGAGTGKMPNNGAISETIATKDGSVAIAKGFHNGEGTVQLAQAEKEKLISANIKSGQTLFGVQGDSNVIDTSADSGSAAGSSQIAKGYKAFVNGQEVDGSMTAATVGQDSSTKVLTIQ